MKIEKKFQRNEKNRVPLPQKTHYLLTKTAF